MIHVGWGGLGVTTGFGGGVGLGFFVGQGVGVGHGVGLGVGHIVGGGFGVHATIRGFAPPAWAVVASWGRFTPVSTSANKSRNETIFFILYLLIHLFVPINSTHYRINLFQDIQNILYRYCYNKLYILSDIAPHNRLNYLHSSIAFTNHM